MWSTLDTPKNVGELVTVSGPKEGLPERHDPMNQLCSKGSPHIDLSLTQGPQTRLTYRGPWSDNKAKKIKNQGKLIDC